MRLFRRICSIISSSSLVDLDTIMNGRQEDLDLVFSSKLTKTFSKAETLQNSKPRAQKRLRSRFYQPMKVSTMKTTPLALSFTYSLKQPKLTLHP